jgi:hypothetical protein
MNFLRGGLNFDLRNVLYDALGSNFHATCFMSSQRYRQDGRWHVKEDMYRKLQIPHGSVLLFGDVVATGVTVDNGVEVIRQHLEQTGTSVRGVVFFTIGCHKLEKALEKHHAQFKQMFPDYEATHVVYFEGKFRLVDQKTRLVIGIPGTDLVKLDALHAPEFEATQYDTITAPLERCVIYDAGSRAFDISEYLRDVIKYWEQVQLLARRGYTLLEALKERWPEREYADHDLFLETKHREWQGVSEDELDAQWARYEVRWTSEFRQWAATADALDCVCEDRRKYIERLLEEAGGNA